jgi:hypothetical protein
LVALLAGHPGGDPGGGDPPAKNRGHTDEDRQPVPLAPLPRVPLLTSCRAYPNGAPRNDGSSGGRMLGKSLQKLLIGARKRNERHHSTVLK